MGLSKLHGVKTMVGYDLEASTSLRECHVRDILTIKNWVPRGMVVVRCRGLCHTNWLYGDYVKSHKDAIRIHFPLL